MKIAASPVQHAPGSAARPKVLISILNWNGASKTLLCLASLSRQSAFASADVTVLVIDNGSGQADAELLQAGLAQYDAVLRREPVNLGFTGGHNVAIAIAMAEKYDYIWLLNNDAMVAVETLDELLRVIQANPRCGAVSPVLRDMIDRTTVVRCVNTHDWTRLSHERIVSIADARAFQAAHPAAVWVDGTAVLFRVAALRDTGPLDDQLFAYYDDNDIGVRLAAKGWVSECAFDTTVLHEVKKDYEEFPLYMVYLLQRNAMLFWTKNTPAPSRRFLTLRLIDRGLFDANRLYRGGWHQQADTLLLGMADFFGGKFGRPRHGRKVPLLFRLACKLSELFYLKRLQPQRAPR